MKKALVAIALATSSIAAQAQISAADCSYYGETVSSMTNIRNEGGSLHVALDLIPVDMIKSSDPLKRNYVKTLEEIGRVIWSKPAGSLNPDSTGKASENICNQTYRL